MLMPASARCVDLTIRSLVSRNLEQFAELHSRQEARGVS